MPTVRHREAWAEQQRAPSRAQWDKEQAEEQAAEREQTQPRVERRIVSASPSAGPIALREQDLPRDILIVVSKLKAYVRARSGMNTSDSAIDMLSDIVRELCDGAIRKAGAEGRKTVMDRDF